MSYATAAQLPNAGLTEDFSRPAVVSAHIETLIGETEKRGATVSDHAKNICRGYKTRMFDLQLIGAYTPQVGAAALERCAQLIQPRSAS